MQGALSADVALALAIGPGEASRIYRTADGGETWTDTQHEPSMEAARQDSIADPVTGICLASEA